MTWVYNNTDRSTLSAVLILFTGNLMGTLLPKTTRVAGFEPLILSLAASVIVAGWGGRQLRRREAPDA